MIKKIFDFIKSYLFTKDEIIIFEFPKNKLSNFSINSDLNIKKVNYDNLKDILNFQDKRYISFIKDFLAQANTHYYAYKGNVCVHRIWVKSNNQIVYPHWAYKYKLRDDEVFIHYAETHPNYKGMGIYPSVLSKIIEDFKEKVKLISVNSKNLPSIKGVKKVGFREIESKNFSNNKCKNSKGIKVMIITQGLNPIVKSLVENYNVIGIIESALRGYIKWSKKKLYLYKIKNFLKFKNNLEFFCKRNNIPYFFMTASNKELEYWVKEKNPDIILIYSMSQLLKENIFNIPKYGTINLHPALLPKYRGPNPIFWQYYNMEKEVGITLHYIDKGEDTGDIIYQEKLEIPLGIREPLLKSILLNLGIKMLFEALENIDDLSGKKQPENSPTLRARNITLEEYKNMIDWENWNIERIWHFFRGTENWFDKVYKNALGFEWIIEDFKKEKLEKFQIGKIYKEGNTYFLACKDGKIFLKRRFSFKKLIKDFLRM